MGEVYRAVDTRLDRTVVVKVLPARTAAHPEWRARLEREARAVSSLKHPHVCALYDIGQQEDVDFLVMEHLEGETLAERLRRGPLPVADVLTFALQIAGALAAAHQRNIVHRDLKPANIMLTPSAAKLLDFGVAKAAPTAAPGIGPGASEPGAPAPSLTHHGALIGTEEYMAPEQIDGGPVDTRADIFAFGAVLYEMTTGCKAFAADNRAGVFDAIRTREVPPLRRLRRRAPRSLDRVVRSCLAKEPGARYQTAAALERDLKAVAVSERRFRHRRWLRCGSRDACGRTGPVVASAEPAAAGCRGSRRRAHHARRAALCEPERRLRPGLSERRAHR
jgi:serine/threonine protein kinase